MVKKEREVTGYGSQDHHRSEGEEGKGSGVCKNAQGVESKGGSVQRVHLWRDAPVTE